MLKTEYIAFDFFLPIPPPKKCIDNCLNKILMAINLFFFKLVTL